MIFWQVISALWWVSQVVFVLIVPCWLVWRGWQSGTATLLAWFLFVAHYAVAAGLHDLVAATHDKELMNSWPDGPSIFAAIFIGWLPGILASTIGMVLRKVLPPRPKPQDGSENSEMRA